MRNHCSPLSNSGWYWISGDGGNTWTKQILTTEEVSHHIADGYMIQKTEPLSKPPHVKVYLVCDRKNQDLTVYSSSPNIDCEKINASSSDVADDDYEEENSRNECRISSLNEAVKRGELSCIM